MIKPSEKNTNFAMLYLKFPADSDGQEVFVAPGFMALMHV